ncbi:transcriptional regulator swi6 [Coemansia sp. RSA 1813]|nr:transcriptional regulator swi6 [Coemansia sp. RSA 1646]KAJ2093164.1 transcriptional regulator swi6 [Coemansia sp. RSA 986]KAJ2217570.1 transcriptional regulator swi6 [Coemansia sp. RSA 487]KAJ2573418.1 transcriptional regulator swi6 [Coemansia sp. RSA 1813]
MSDTDISNSVYAAIYSGIQVYEMICRGIAVMRRHSDSWLNATQLLKVAGVEKGRRTKILEREVLTGVHEKIQGGYGKYQGTWVPFTRGVQLCKQYGVYDYVRPILEHDPTASGTRPDKTPTKAEVRKFLKSTQKQPVRPSGALAASAKRELAMCDPSTQKRYKASPSVATSPLNSDITGVFHPGSYSQGIIPSTPAFPPVDTGPASRTGSLAAPHRSTVYSSPAVNYLTDAGSASVGSAWGYHTANEDVSSQTVVDNDGGSFSNASRGKSDRMELMKIFLNDDPSFIPEWLAQVDDANDTASCSPLAESETLSSSQSYKVNVDLVIDDQGHTAVHWAAALARIQVLDLLLYRGADARLLNDEGESALVRAVQVTNNYENQTFPDLLELLHDTIPLTDKNNRTVLHHISLAAGIDSRERAARYYADCLLSWIVRLAGGYQVDAAENTDPEIMHKLANGAGMQNGTVRLTDDDEDKPLALHSSGQQQTTQPALAHGESNGSLLSTEPSDDRLATAENSRSATESDTIPNADFAAFLNLQDVHGNTALNIAARVGDRAIIRMLLNAGASPTIANRVGLCPLDFGVDKIAHTDSEAGIYMIDALFDEGVPNAAGATPLALASKRTGGPALDALGSPTPSSRKRSSYAVRGSTPVNNGTQLPQTPLRSALKGVNKNLLSSLIASRNGTHGQGGSMADGGSAQDVWSPVAAEKRMHQSVISIQRLMSELETNFAGEMRIKHEHFEEIKYQLRNTTIELAKARETIHQLQAKTAQLAEAKSRVGYLEETLARETSALRETINALPAGSKPRKTLESLLESLLTTPDGSSPFKSISTELNLPFLPDGAFGKNGEAEGGDEDDDLDELENDPERLRAAVERLRTVNQVYAQRDMLLHERVAALRMRADVSERERQYRQIIASCCEISDDEVDIWIDKLVSAVQSSDAHSEEVALIVNGNSVLDGNGLSAETAQDTVAARV